MSTEDQSNVAERAYQLWDAAGRPEGVADRFWHEAEHELGADNIQIETAPVQAAEQEQAKATKKPK
jgi:hypothetical protein